MICPQDQQPCTWDHSEDCYRNCSNETREQRIARSMSNHPSQHNSHSVRVPMRLLKGDG